MPSKDEAPKRSRGASSTKKPQGWGAVAKRQAEVAERKESVEGAVREFWLKEDESAVIQFLQDEPFCFDAHTVKTRGGKFATVPCQLNTKKHCALCNEGVKQTWKAAFKLLDYRGSWDKDKKRFKHDTPVEKIWIVGPTIANQIKQQMDKRKKELTELVFEVSRSGAGKESLYNFEMAFDDKDRRLRPIEWEEKLATAEECCQPPTDDEIDEAGYEAARD